MESRSSVRYSSLIAAFTAIFILTAFGISFASEPIEPLAGTWKNSIVPKHRAIITYMDNDNRTMVTFRGQDRDVLPDLSGNFGTRYRTPAGDMDLSGADDKRVFSMTSAGGMIRSELTLENGFYGQETFADVPKGVVANAYIAMKSANGIGCGIFLELTDENGRIGKAVEAKNIPEPAYRFSYNDDGKEREGPELDRSVFSDLMAHDWSGDGFTDYVLSYVHNQLGNNKFGTKEEDKVRLILLYIDGKSLYDAVNANDSSRLRLSHNDSAKFGDMTARIYYGKDLFKPANSARLAIGDVDGDGAKELVAYYTLAGRDPGVNDNSMQIFKIEPGKSQTFRSIYHNTRDMGGSNQQNDVVSVAVGDLDGDGIDEICLPHAKNPATKKGDAKKNPSVVYLDVWKYVGGNLKKLYGEEVFKWYNVHNDRSDISIAPLDSAIADFDGDGIEELAMLDLSPSNPGKITLWIVKWKEGNIESSPAPAFKREYDISAQCGWSINWSATRSNMKSVGIAA